jgi:hypothetical protein
MRAFFAFCTLTALFAVAAALLLAGLLTPRAEQL